MLLSKMKDLPDLNNKFNELFETVKFLKKENDLLIKSMKINKILKMLEQEEGLEPEQVEEEKEDEDNIAIKDKKELNIKENEKEENGKDKEGKIQILTVEELEIFENIIKDVENIMKKLENKNDEDGKEEEEDNKAGEENENIENENENEEEKNIEELNMKKKLLLNEMFKSLGLNDMNLNENSEEIKNVEKKEDNNKDLPLKINNINNITNDETKKEKNDINIPNKIYNKKLLRASPKTIKKVTDNKNLDNNIKNNIYYK